MVSNEIEVSDPRERIPKLSEAHIATSGFYWV
jgi:hypothetical protein